MSQIAPAYHVPGHVPQELVVDFDVATDEAMKSDVFRRIAEVRNSAPPVAWTPYNGGNWLAFGGREIETILTDSDRFSNAFMSESSQAAGGPVLIPLGMDPPDHLPYRTMLLRHLGPNRIRKLEQVISAKAVELIAPLASKKACEFVGDIAEPIPVFIFMELMGLPVDRFQEFRTLATQMLSPEALNSPEFLGAASIGIMTILSDLIAARRLEPKDDLISALIGETVNGKPIGPSELLSVCFMLFLGGLDTVTNAMAYGIRNLAIDQDLQESIRKDRSLVSALVERLLRANSFVNSIRMVKCDTELGGASLKAGDTIWCLTWPGSNEPGGPVDGPRHLAFGYGHHMCVGMHLARVELKAMYEAWFDHIGDFSLIADDMPVMKGGPLFHMKRLPLRLESA